MILRQSLNDFSAKSHWFQVGFLKNSPMGLNDNWFVRIEDGHWVKNPKNKQKLEHI